MSGAFISYAREDSQWVRQLVESLAALELDPWVDWERIVATDDWWGTITNAIDAADAFVYVISPSAAASQTCSDEVQRAADGGKRIVPVVLEPVDPDVLPRAISARQWVLSEAVSHEELARLIHTAYHTDLPWLREQSELISRLSRWEQSQRAREFEIRGSELESAEKWLAKADARDSRVATPKQVEYILLCRRHRSQQTRNALIVTLLVLAVVAVLGVIAFVLYRRSESERRGAVAERLAAESVRARLEHRPQRAVLLGAAAVRALSDRGDPPAVEALDALYTASSGLGGTPIVHVDGAVEAIALLEGGKLIVGGDDGKLRLFEPAGGPVLATVVAHAGGVTRVVANRDDLVVSTGADRVVRLWKVDHNSFRVLGMYEHSAKVVGIRLSADASYLVSTSWDGKIGLHHLVGGVISKTEEFVISDAMDAALDPTGRWLGAIDARGSVTLIDRTLQPGTRIEIPAMSSAGSTLGFSPDSRWLAASGLATDIALFDLASSPPTMSLLKGHGNSIFALAFSEDSHWLASGGDDGRAILWDLGAANAKPLVLPNENSSVRAVAFVPGPSLRIVAATQDHDARLWTVDPSEPDSATPVTLRGHDDVITALAISGKSSRLFTAARDGSVRSWDLSDREPGRASFVAVHRDHSDEVKSLAVARDGSRAVSTDFSGAACSWSLPTFAARCRKAPIDQDQRIGLVPCPDWDAFLVRGRRGQLHLCGTAASPCTTLTAARANILAAACSASSIAAIDGEGRVFFWPGSPGHLSPTPQELKPPMPKIPLSLTFSPDGGALAGGSASGMVVLWKLPEGKGFELSGHTDGVPSLSFSSNGRHLVSGSFDAVALEWDVETLPPRLVATLRGHQQGVAKLGVTDVEFDPRDRFIATGGVDTTVRLWPLIEGAAKGDPRVLTGHTEGTFRGGVKSVDMTERWLASAGEDGVVRLWDLTSETPALAGIGLLGHSGPVRAVHFISDGEQLATASDDATVRVWPIGTNRLLAAACSEVGRDLTPDEATRYFRASERLESCEHRTPSP